MTMIEMAFIGGSPVNTTADCIFGRGDVKREKSCNLSDARRRLQEDGRSLSRA
jgi:hypothetical protein